MNLRTTTTAPKVVVRAMTGGKFDEEHGFRAGGRLAACRRRPQARCVKKEMAKFQGTWKFVSVKVDGMKMPDRAFTKATVVLKGDQWTVCEGKGCAAKLTVRLDPTKKPKTIDLVDMDVEKERFIRGIYSLQGDTLTVCYHRDPEQEGDRPTEFATKPDSGFVLFVLKREKP